MCIYWCNIFNGQEPIAIYISIVCRKHVHIYMLTLLTKILELAQIYYCSIHNFVSSSYKLKLSIDPEP